MLEIYKLISDVVEPICTSYADHYPEDTENAKRIYPYTEIKCPNTIPNNSYSDNILLELDIWDNKGTDITEIEGITDTIHQALNRLQYNGVNMNVSINRNNPYRLVIPDTTPHIQRRELRYVVTIYNK